MSGSNLPDNVRVRGRASCGALLLGAVAPVPGRANTGRRIPLFRFVRPPARASGTVCKAIDFDGLTRTFRLYVSGPDAPQLLALVFVLHGRLGNCIGMVRMTEGGFNDLAERDGTFRASSGL